MISNLLAIVGVSVVNTEVEMRASLIGNGGLIDVSCVQGVQTLAHTM